jgi:hypothetical protein
MSYIRLYTTKDNIEICVSRGTKSKHDFKVAYKEPGKRVRTPKHIHIVVDLYMKFSKNERLTLKLVDHLIEMIKKIKPVKKYPPKLQLFKKADISRFKELNKYGEYSVEFILVVAELIMIQEKTNYPRGTMNLKLFETFRNRGDIFSVISAATFRR